MSICLRRREFVAALGSAAAWPLAARAQQGDRVRRVGVLMPYDENDPVAELRLSAFTQALADLNWTVGRNVRMDFRAAITGFALNEATMGGKWLELLSEIAPGLNRVAIMFNPNTAPVSTYLPSLETAARSLKIVPTLAHVHSDVEIETAIIALGSERRGGLIVMPDVFMIAHRAPVISAAARNNVPAIYALSEAARDGGLLSYGPDFVDNLRRAATYVDRILRGAKPGDLPVQV